MISKKITTPQKAQVSASETTRLCKASAEQGRQASPDTIRANFESHK
jgi:hypothetical protein